MAHAKIQSVFGSKILSIIQSADGKKHRDNWIEVPSVNYWTYILKAYTNDYGRYLKSWFVFGRIYMYSQKEKNKTIMILTLQYNSD